MFTDFAGGATSAKYIYDGVSFIRQHLNEKFWKF